MCIKDSECLRKSPHALDNVIVGSPKSSCTNAPQTLWIHDCGRWDWAKERNLRERAHPFKPRSIFISHSFVIENIYLHICWTVCLLLDKFHSLNVPVGIQLEFKCTVVSCIVQPKWAACRACLDFSEIDIQFCVCISILCSLTNSPIYCRQPCVCTFSVFDLHRIPKKPSLTWVQIDKKDSTTETSLQVSREQQYTQYC